MSRIGRMPIAVPAGVSAELDGDNLLTVKGPKGTLSQRTHPNMKINGVSTGEITVARPDDTKHNKSLHGLTRSLVANMVTGVTAGFTKELDINGVGYRAQLQGSNLVLNIGYSHQVTMPQPEGLKIEVPAPNKIVISGSDKQRVGQLAADIREKRPPEPYKGKGIKYSTEVIRRKEGKAGGKKK